LRAQGASCIFRRTSSSKLLQTKAEQLKGSISREQAGAGVSTLVEHARAPSRPRRFGFARHRGPKRKSLQTTETTSNTVRTHIARAAHAPHTNADGPPATERAHAPL